MIIPMTWGVPIIMILMNLMGLHNLNVQIQQIVMVTGRPTAMINVPLILTR